MAIIHRGFGYYLAGAKHYRRPSVGASVFLRAPKNNGAGGLSGFGSERLETELDLTETNESDQLSAESEFPNVMEAEAADPRRILA